jgi:hypothetical protein
VSQNCKIATTLKDVVDTYVRASENIPKIASSAFFGGIHERRARKTCIIRTSERLHKLSSGATPGGSRYSWRSEQRRSPVQHMASATPVDTGGRLIELMEWFHQNDKRVVSVRSVKKGLVACASGDKRQFLAPNTSRSEPAFANVGMMKAATTVKTMGLSQ